MQEPAYMVELVIEGKWGLTVRSYQKARLRHDSTAPGLARAPRVLPKPGAGIGRTTIAFQNIR